ncbi:isochorismatase family protein [Chloroflexota bacterium]
MHSEKTERRENPMFGWEKFMTERDKEHYKVTGKKDFFGFGDKPALLLIDIYYGVLGLKREPILEQIKKIPGGMGLEGWDAVDRTAKLLEITRDLSIPVVHVTRLDSDSVASWAKRIKAIRADNRQIPEELRRRSGEIVSEVAPIKGELVIRKAAPSAFQGTPLSFMLRSMDIDTLIVCGESTSGCVRATVVDGATHSYHMGVVAECCFDRTEMSHYVNLFDMHQKYADVIDMDHAVQYFKKRNNNSALS